MTHFRILKDHYDEDAIRFVIVDDSEEILQIWKRVFQRESKCIVFITSDPWVALREIEIQKPDVLITDVMMPGLSGFQLAQKAKQIFPPLQVFFTTGSLDQLKGDGSLEEALEVLKKPYADVNNVQSFVHDLATQQPLDRSHCTKDGKFFLWSL